MKGQLFAGTGVLTRFALRRDRLWLAAWLVGLTAFAVGFVPVFQNLLTSGETDKRVMMEMMQNPAMVAIVGPVFGTGNYTTGAAYANMMLVFTALAVGVMNVFLVARHTRQDEEQGRLEVIRSLPVGRLANLAAALAVALLANAALALASGAGLYVLREEGMTLMGCALYGAALGAMGLFFAAATAVCCQLTANNRTATSMAMMLLMALYILRAAGDVAAEPLALASPLGLVLRTEAFVQNHWRPVWAVLGMAAALAALAFGLARMRDLGRGLLPEKGGRRHASALVNGPFGLAAKLLRTSLVVWAVTVFVLAGMYGSVFGEMESFIGGNEMLTAVFAQNPDLSLLDQFISLLMAVMTMMSTVPLLTIVHRIGSEETKGHTEHLLGRSVSRYSQMAAYLLPALLFSVLLQLLAALGFWGVGRMVLSTTPSLQTFLVSAFSFLPAMWVMVGISALLMALFGGLGALNYVYLGYAFLAVYLGSIAGFPEWSKKLTPFGHISQYPVEEIDPLPLMVMSGIAVALMATGFWLYRRRDMKTA